jgi:copper chaperone CopZ
MPASTVQLRITGMTCDGCAQTIQRMLAREAGVRSVAVDWRQRRARVLMDAARPEAARIADAAVFRSHFNAEVIGIESMGDEVTEQ